MTKEELLHLYLFCFCAFTSLRYSDMAALKRTDIIGDTMYITTQKTKADAMKLIEDAWDR